MNTYISRLRYFVSCLVPACAVFAFTDASAAPTSSNTAGKVPPYGADLTANETKAVTLIRTATEVDLADVKQFASRELSGHFIRRLLLDEAGIARKQIVISNAVIADELNCFMETITVQAVFKKCHFQGVQFGQVTFEKSIAFSECSFAGPANFEEVIAEKNFAINLSTFSEKASFGYARIKGNFSTLQATFLHETEAAVFAYQIDITIL